MSWIAVGVVAGSAVIGGAVGSMASSGDGGDGSSSITTMDNRSEGQKAQDSWIAKYLPNFKPGEKYSGDLSAPMSTYENQGMGFLQQYLTDAKTNGNPLLGLAGNELTKTFTGGYDPSTSEFYKATRDAAMTERQDALNVQNQGLGARGKFFSSEALNENQQLNTRTSNFLQQTLTGMAEKERQNRLNAVPMAVNLDKAQTAASLAPVAAATTFGALPRELEQQDLERQYQEYTRQRSEMSLPITKGAGPGLTTVGTNNKAAPAFDWGSFLGQIGSTALTAAIA
jgi:hypothetical protein